MAHAYATIHVHSDDSGKPPVIVGRTPFRLPITRKGSAPYGWGIKVDDHEMMFYGFGVEVIDALVEELQKVRAEAVEIEGKDGASA